LRAEKIYYNTFAYFDSITTKRNLTWKRDVEEEEKRIFLANAKLSDPSGALWVTLTTGGETVLGMLPSEAYALQENFKNEGEDESSKRDSEFLQKIASRKGCGFWVKLMAKMNSYNGINSVRYSTINAYESPSQSDPNCQKMNRALLNTYKML